MSMIGLAASGLAGLFVFTRANTLPLWDAVLLAGVLGFVVSLSATLMGLP